MANLPQLTNNEMTLVMELRSQHPGAFMSNQTKFLIGEMRQYILDKRIFRISIMGETRVGKSEVGTSIGILYKNIFNECFDRGVFKDVDVYDGTKLKSGKIKFNVNYIVGSQEDYIIELRKTYSEGKLTFGQIFQIDENRDAIGGLGSFSTEIDLRNINNIVAKYMISEIWITPTKFLDRNTPYGIYVMKKDLKNRVNWGLLYKIKLTEQSVHEYVFLGWVCIPLHKDNKLRKDYNIKKNEWINDEMLGKSNKRTQLRKDASKLLAKDTLFGKLTDSGKQFKLSKSQQVSILENYIEDGKLQDFNEAEKWRIIDEARLIILEMSEKHV